MKKIAKSLAVFMILLGSCAAPLALMADDAAPAEMKAGESAETAGKKGGGFMEIVFPGGSFTLGTFLWFVLFADFGIAVYFMIDCSVLIKPEKLMPKKLLDNVQAAIAEGDVVKAMEACEADPSPMSSIVLAAFQHIEEGFEAIQEAVTGASDLEQEKLQQRINWVSVCGNLGPSLGLLGTVQGMIETFNALASGGAGDASALANSIGQALWTTAGGLIVSIPSITMFYILRNKANRLILMMTAKTMEILNSLRNVSVEGDEGAAQEYEA